MDSTTRHYTSFMHARSPRSYHHTFQPPDDGLDPRSCFPLQSASMVILKKWQGTGDIKDCPCF